MPTATGGAVRQIRLVFSGDTKDLSKSAKNGEKQMSRWQAGFKKANQAAVKWSLGVGAASVVAGKELFDVSQRMDELDQKSSTVFGDQLGDIQKWAQENKKAFGTSSREVTALAANFADLLKPMGFTTEEAAEMSKEVTGLAPALARWEGKGRSAAEVQDILAKAMLGEREGLKSLGISITEADVKRELAQRGLEELTGAELEQARALVTRDLIMAKSTDAQEAWANGGRAAAEQQNALSSTMQTVKESLATSLTPAFEAGLTMVEKFSGVIEDNTGAVKIAGATIVGLAGFVLVANGAYKVYRATMIAVTGVTKGLTLAQKALNLAMRANPIGIVITVLAALVTGFIAAYKKSETFRRIVDGALSRVKSVAVGLKDFFVGLPGTLARVFGRVRDIITAPFRSAFNSVRSWWNSTVGGFGFDIPGWVPGVGGRSFRIPFMHTGGVFDAGPGRTEGLAMLRDGETVRTTEQEAALTRPIIVENHIEIGGETVRIIRQEIAANGRELARSALAGAGTMFGEAAA